MLDVGPDDAPNGTLPRQLSRATLDAAAEPDGALTGTGLPEESEASSLRAAAAAVLESRKDLEFALKTQLRHPTSDLSLALALLKRWNLWFGIKGAGAKPSSAHMFGRELAVSWHVNPKPLLAIVDKKTVPILTNLLQYMSDRVVDNPLVTAMQLLPLKEGQVMAGYPDTDDDVPDLDATILAIRSSWLQFGSTDVSPVGYPEDEFVKTDPSSRPPHLDIQGVADTKANVQAKAKARPGMPVRSQSQPTLSHFSENRKQLSQMSLKERYDMQEAASTPPTSPRWKTRQPMEAWKSQTVPRKKVENVRMLRSERKNSPKSESAKRKRRARKPRSPMIRTASPKRGKEGIAEAAQRGTDRQDWMHMADPSTAVELKRNVVEQKRQEEERIRKEKIHHRRKAWDRDKEVRAAQKHHAMHEHVEKEKEHFAHQQAKKEVLQLVVRINYALNSGVVRSLNGVRITSIRSLFESIDVDKSGSISQEELVEALRVLKINISQEHIHMFMRVIDADHSGDLALVELLKWWEQTEVVQAAAQATEDRRRTEGDAANKAVKHRRVHTSPSHTVGQLRAAMKAGRKLNGKTLNMEPRSFFEAMDEDKTGVLHPYEIDRGLKRLGIFLSKGDIQALVETIDNDGNGCLTLTEIEYWLDYRLVGAIVATQIREVLDERRTLYGFTVRDADSLFDAIDLSGNGYLDFGELSVGLKKLQLNVGHPDLDAFVATLGKDRDSLLGKAELRWALDFDNQLNRIRALDDQRRATTSSGYSSANAREAPRVARGVTYTWIGDESF